MTWIRFTTNKNIFSRTILASASVLCERFVGQNAKKWLIIQQGSDPFQSLYCLFNFHNVYRLLHIIKIKIYSFIMRSMKLPKRKKTPLDRVHAHCSANTLSLTSTWKVDAITWMAAGCALVVAYCALSGTDWLTNEMIYGQGCWAAIYSKYWITSDPTPPPISRETRALSQVRRLVYLEAQCDGVPHKRNNLKRKGRDRG